jgi:hypothetical protein
MKRPQHHNKNKDRDRRAFRRGLGSFALVFMVMVVSIGVIVGSIAFIVAGAGFLVLIGTLSGLGYKWFLRNTDGT